MGIKNWFNEKKFQISSFSKVAHTLDYAILIDKRNPNIFNNVKDGEDFNKYCFVCSSYMDEPTKEHVIPQWILKKLDMYNQRAKVPNKSMIPFRQLTVPCCQKCNNEELSSIEENTKLVFTKPLKNLSNDDDNTIFYWLLKIYLAFAVKSTQLAKDRKEKNADTLLTINDVVQLKSLFYLMSTIKNKTIFKNFKPYSLFSFDINLDNWERKIAFQNNPTQHSIFFALDNRAFMCYFNDDMLIKYIYDEDYIFERKNILEFEVLLDLYSSGLATMHLTKYFKRKYKVEKDMFGKVSIEGCYDQDTKLEGLRRRSDDLKMQYKAYNYDELPS